MGVSQGPTIISAAKPRPLTAWAITTGEAGMRTQARGLAAAVASVVVEKVVRVRWPWSWLQAGWPGVLTGVQAIEGGPLAPPWPDLIVSSGRRSAIVAIAVKRAAGSRPVLVHAQDPLTNPRLFDLIVAMEHDRVRGPNVMRVVTALHDLTPQRLTSAGVSWKARLAHLPRPMTGVLLGGPTRGSDFGVAQARELQSRLAALRTNQGGSYVIVPSRRTPDEALSVFQTTAQGDPGVLVWDRSGDNPYAGVLALADRLVVTGDSVSMISEALATPHPVEVFASDLRKRHEGFVRTLVDQGLVRIFDGRPSDPVPRPVVDATRRAAETLNALLADRG
jgi:mitochondrial fission protein ELM1